jgi:hypothetical protein
MPCPLSHAVPRSCNNAIMQAGSNACTLVHRASCRVPRAACRVLRVVCFVLRASSVVLRPAPCTCIEKRRAGRRQGADLGMEHGAAEGACFHDRGAGCSAHLLMEHVVWAYGRARLRLEHRQQVLRQPLTAQRRPHHACPSTRVLFTVPHAHHPSSPRPRRHRLVYREWVRAALVATDLHPTSQHLPLRHICTAAPLAPFFASTHNCREARATHQPKPPPLPHWATRSHVY